MRLSPNLDEVVIVASDRTRWDARGGNRRHSGRRRMLRQQASLDLDGKRDVSPQLLLLDHPIRQACVLDNQRKLIGRAPEHALFDCGVRIATRRRTKHEHSKHFVLRTKRRCQPSPHLLQHDKLDEPLWPVLVRPSDQCLKINFLHRQRRR